jgi:lactate dehydrogenase-like 2-hydroxyacid dehydrogenase
MRGTFDDQLPLHVLTMILTLNRNFHLYRDQQTAHVYGQLPDNATLDSSSTVVVVGVGAAGMEVARLCKQVFVSHVIPHERASPHHPTVGSVWFNQMR